MHILIPRSHPTSQPAMDSALRGACSAFRSHYEEALDAKGRAFWDAAPHEAQEATLMVLLGLRLAERLRERDFPRFAFMAEGVAGLAMELVLEARTAEGEQAH